MRPDEVVQAVLNRARLDGAPTEFRCDECGRHEPILLLAVAPDPWETTERSIERFAALCQTCYSYTRKGEQLELALHIGG